MENCRHSWAEKAVGSHTRPRMGESQIMCLKSKESSKNSTLVTTLPIFSLSVKLMNCKNRFQNMSYLNKLAVTTPGIYFLTLLSSLVTVTCYVCTISSL